MDQTYGRALRTLTVTSLERLKNHFVHTKFVRTRFMWTVHVLSKMTNAIVIPPIFLESARHCNCFLICNTCLQYYTGLCKSVEFYDG